MTTSNAYHVALHMALQSQDNCTLHISTRVGIVLHGKCVDNALCASGFLKVFQFSVKVLQRNMNRSKCQLCSCIVVHVEISCADLQACLDTICTRGLDREMLVIFQESKGSVDGKSFCRSTFRQTDQNPM